MKNKKRADPKDLYKSGGEYGIVSPKDVYKSGGHYGIISPNDF